MPDLKQAFLIKDTWIDVNKETKAKYWRKVGMCLH